MEDGHRLESRVLEERIQSALAKGHLYLEVEAFGQHGIGGRLWRAGDKAVYVKIYGSPGQRVGSMGFPNTHIEIMGPASLGRRSLSMATPPMALAMPWPKGRSKLQEASAPEA